MERRRSLRLLEKEIEKKKAKMNSTSSSEPIIQNSPIFDSKIRDVLPNIINHLDPGSFVKLARTCKEMNYICFNDKEIQIPCWDENSAIGHAGVEMAFGATNCVLTTTKSIRQYSADSDFVKNLAKMPFVFNVGLIIRPRADERILRELRNFLSYFPRVSVDRFLAVHIVDWGGLVEFIKDFPVDVLSVPSNDANITYILPSREVLSFITQNLSELIICGYVIPDDIIMRATVMKLETPQARISKETFKELIKKFAAGDFKEWTIGREPFMVDDEGSDDDIEDEEANEAEADPFITAVSEVMKAIEVEDIDRNAIEPSTAYFTPGEPYEFSILKSDGSLGYFTVFPHFVILGE